MVRNKIIQPWDNNGRLGLIVYGSDSQNNISTTFASSNVGQGSGALAWLIGDVRGNGKADIIQPWDNNGRLGLIVYGFDVPNSISTRFASSNVGQGSGALAWLIGDIA